MATEVIATVIPGGGGDYSLLSSFESGEQRNLVSADEIAVAECHAGPITDNVLFTGWTTDATRFIHARNATGHEHGGLPGAGFRMSASAAPVIDMRQDSRIEGIVLKAPATVGAHGISYPSAASHTVYWVSECVIQGAGGDIAALGIRTATNATGRVWNNIIFDFQTTANNDGSGFQSSAGTAHVYNNTIINCRNGIRRQAGTVRPKNNIVQATVQAGFLGTMTDAATNIASDTTGQIQATLTFADAANDDYHLDATDTDAIGAGTDLSADANLAFADDIDGDARPAGDWDIGADQTAAAAANELSGTPSAQPADASGTMAAVASASGAPSATAATADGVMQHVSPVAGTPQAAPATSAGTLQALIQLSGAPTAEPATSAGTLVALASMAGAAAAERAASAGTVGVVVSMSGAVQASTAEVFGGRMDDGTGPSPDGFFGSDEWWI